MTPALLRRVPRKEEPAYIPEKMEYLERYLGLLVQNARVLDRRLNNKDWKFECQQQWAPHGIPSFLNMANSEAFNSNPAHGKPPNS